MGVVAGPLFVAGFTALGARAPEYDWRRDVVSSLAHGPLGYLQRLNFLGAGASYVLAASGLVRCPRRVIGSRTLPTLVAVAGLGLIGAGLFVADPVSGFPAESRNHDSGDSARLTADRSRSDRLHNICALTVFVDVPLAGLLEAASFARDGERRWASFSAASSIVMSGSFVMFVRAFADASNGTRRVGVFQRISIAVGLSWLSARSLRALTSLRRS